METKREKTEDTTRKKRRKTGRFTKVAKSTISFSLYAVRSEYFINICKRAFQDTDLDNSGSINETELFAAVLYLYHMINLRVPGRNHKPPRFEDIRIRFKEYDIEKKNELNQEQFVAFCQDQVMELLPRVFVTCIGSLVLAPFAALLLYALFKLSLKVTTPSLLVSAFDHIPRALLTPLFASLFTVLILPHIVDAVEAHYDSILESQQVQAFSPSKHTPPRILKSKKIQNLIVGALEKFSNVSQQPSPEHKVSTKDDEYDDGDDDKETVDDIMSKKNR